MAWLIAYVTSALVMGGLDFVWLTNTKPMYKRALGDALAADPDMRAGVAFYLLYLVGVMIFAVRPALASGDWRTATLFGALFGFFAYATYDLTNLATLKTFTLAGDLLRPGLGHISSPARRRRPARWRLLKFAR